MMDRGKSDQLIINTIRTLSMDAVQQANSGHPGTPMALAPVAYVIWEKFLRYNPKNPDWPNRDRFVLSAGHASMLLYSILHITGYDVSLDDIKRFRQLHGKCAGHPEHGLAPGVETTTGPLGQGVATSVGFAIAEKWLARYFNRPDRTIIDYKVLAIAGDGDMMEGLSSEAASLAGHLGLDNLIWIYDNNHITIEGETTLAFSEDVAARFLAYHWNVQHVADANDLGSLERAIRHAYQAEGKPSFIMVDSHIAYGSPNKQDSSDAHGSPLGEEEVRKTKEVYGWDPDRKFYVPDEIARFRERAIKRGGELEGEWKRVFANYEREYPDLAKEFRLMQDRGLPDGWDSQLPIFEPVPKGLATRNANHKILNAIAKKVPWFLGGAADLGNSTKTYIEKTASFAIGEPAGRNFHFGIRENAMAAVSNGMALSKLRPYAATFLVFSDYMRPSLRLSCIMKQPVIYIFTHDSIGVGEDGPTHQPIEHIASLRAIPHLHVIRPADANELSVLWRHIMKLNDGPIALLLTRQEIPIIDRKRYAAAEGALRGAYTLADCIGTPDIILIATGSEVSACLEAHEMLKSEGVKSRVVSMPSWILFERQDHLYRETVLPASVQLRIVVEAGSTLGWERFAGGNGDERIIGMKDFGESAPVKDLLEEYGFTPPRIADLAKKMIRGSRSSKAV